MKTGGNQVGHIYKLLPSVKGTIRGVTWLLLKISAVAIEIIKSIATRSRVT